MHTLTPSLPIHRINACTNLQGADTNPDGHHAMHRTPAHPPKKSEMLLQGRKRSKQNEAGYLGTRASLGEPGPLPRLLPAPGVFIKQSAENQTVCARVVVYHRKNPSLAKPEGLLQGWMHLSPSRAVIWFHHPVPLRCGDKS